MLTLRQAAEAVGMSKPGVLKAIKSGKVSAEKNIRGQYQIQAAELFRVYDPISRVNGNGHEPVNPEGNENSSPSLREETSQSGSVNASYQVELDGLRLELAHQKQLLAMSGETVIDLRQRLDESQSQVTQLTAVVAQLAPPQSRKGWWTRLLGG